MPLISAEPSCVPETGGLPAKPCDYQRGDETMPTTAELERQKQERLTQFQARYDSVLEPLKRAAAPPTQGIGVNEYRRRSLGFIQKFLPPESKWGWHIPGWLQVGRLERNRAPDTR